MTIGFSWRRTIKRIFILFFVGLLVFLSFAMGMAFLIEIPARLVIGWLIFAVETFPKAAVNRVMLVNALITLVLLCVSAHYLFRWFYNQGEAKAKAKPWRIGWTLSLVSLLILMFGASIAFIGGVHQAIWLVTSEEPFLKRPSFGSKSREKAACQRLVSHAAKISRGEASYYQTHGVYTSDLAALHTQNFFYEPDPEYAISIRLEEDSYVLKISGQKCKKGKAHEYKGQINAALVEKADG